MEQPKFKYIDTLADGDLIFKNKLLTVIKNEFPKELHQYHEALKQKDLFLISEIVHKLKNKISMLGLEEGYLVAQAYEEGLKKGELSHKVLFEEILLKMAHFIKSF